jgi:hypothetical protein
MDITIKNIEGLTEQEVLEWVAILVERKENQKISPPQTAIELAKRNTDDFRVANNLKEKFRNLEIGL